MKRLFIIIALFGISLFPNIFTTSVWAADVLPNQCWRCMQVTRVGGHSVSLQSNFADGFTYPGDSYVVECLTSENGGYCTTGNATADSYLGIGGVPPEFTISNNAPQPAKLNFSTMKLAGEPYTWQTDGPGADHTYFQVTIIPPPPDTSDVKAMKYSTFYANNSNITCLSQRWDPYGIVFDSLSLEPIPDISISLFDKNKQLFQLIGLKNPVVTDQIGSYNFSVPEGWYSLTTIASSHTFPSKKDSLPYQNDILFPYSHIYHGESFFEPEGIPQQLDIPIDSLGTPFRREAAVTDWGMELDKITNEYRMHGGVRHPFSNIKVVNDGKVMETADAGKFGKFEVYVKSTLVNNSLPLEIVVTKPEIMRRTASYSAFLNNFSFLKSLKFLSPVSAQDITGTLRLEPIINYLEGYAYDKSNKIIPNATIQILAINYTKPFYTTHSDAKGFFKIESHNLPPFSYSIQISSENGISDKLTTSQFVQQNQEYANINNIDYSTYQSETDTSNRITPKIISPTTVVSTENKNTSSVNTPGYSDTQRKNNIKENPPFPQTKEKYSSILTVILTLIILSIISGIVITLLIKRRIKIKSIPETEDLHEVTSSSNPL